MSKLVNASEASKILGIKNQHYIGAVTTWLKLLPYQRVGNVIAIDKNELKEFAEKYGIPYHDDNGNNSDQKIN